MFFPVPQCNGQADVITSMTSNSYYENSLFCGHLSGESAVEA